MAHIARLSSDQSHLAWDNALPPAVRVAPGDTIELDVQDASGGQIGPQDGVDAVGRLDFAAVNPCTGPVFVEGADPGDELVVTILDIATEGWGWTANIPGFGLLAEDFPDPYLQISTVADGRVRLPNGLEISARPMIGTIGVAPSRTRRDAASGPDGRRRQHGHPAAGHRRPAAPAGPGGRRTPVRR